MTLYSEMALNKRTTLSVTIQTQRLWYYPNPDIETRIRVQTIGAHSKSKKYRVTLLVMWCFLDLLGVSRDCAINVFSISELGYYKSLQLLSLWMGTVTSVLNNESLQAALQDKKLQVLLYQELRIIARAKLNKHAKSDDLGTTALVHEAFLKLNGQSENKQWSNRRHFYATAALAMRHILVDQARQRLTEKRGQQPSATTLTNLSVETEQECQELVALNDALEQLKSVDGQLVELVHLRYFVGLTVAEIADIMSVSKRTVDREWHKAKALLAAWMT